MQKVSESVGKRDQKLPENRNNHDLSPLAACQSSFRKKNNSVIILLKTRQKKKALPRPGIIQNSCELSGFEPGTFRSSV